MCNSTAARTPNSRREKRSAHKRKHTTHSECPHRHIPRTGANGEGFFFSTLDTKAASTSCLNIWFSSQHVATSTLKGPISRRFFCFFSDSNPLRASHQNGHAKTGTTDCQSHRVYGYGNTKTKRKAFQWHVSIPFLQKESFVMALFTLLSKKKKQKNMSLLIEYPSIYVPPRASRALRAAGVLGSLPVI